MCTSCGQALLHLVGDGEFGAGATRAALVEPHYLVVEDSCNGHPDLGGHHELGSCLIDLVEGSNGACAKYIGWWAVYASSLLAALQWPDGTAQVQDGMPMHEKQLRKCADSMHGCCAVPARPLLHSCSLRPGVAYSARADTKSISAFVHVLAWLVLPAMDT